MIDGFDRAILSFLNRFARQSWTFDSFVVFVSQDDLLKGGIVVAILWWAWFSLQKDELERTKPILCAFLSCFLALFVARALALTLPFRARPVHSQNVHFQAPYALYPGLEDWSSFPSDHATLFFSLALSIFLMSRRLGMIAFGYVLGIIALPRIYLGLHYPTDVIAGGLLAILITGGVNSSQTVKNLLHAGAMPVYRKSRGAFYAGCFLVSYEIANLFEGVRAISHFAFKVLKLVAARLGY